MTLSPLVREALGSLAQYIQAPRTELPIREWLAQKYNWYPHRGQEPIFIAVEEALGHEGYLNEIDLMAGKRAGKCLDADTLVLLGNGRRVRIADVAPGDTVLSLGEDWKLHKATVVAKKYAGRKEAYALTLESGRRVVATNSHPFLSEHGWRPLAGLQPGELLATPRRYPELGTQHADADEMALLGYLVGDGGLTNGTPRFSNADPAILKHLAACLPEGVSLKHSDRYDYAISGKPNGGRIANPVSIMLERWGVNGKLSKDKFVPTRMFVLSTGAMAPFIRALYDCDGTVGSAGCEIVLASEKLIDDLQHLLLRYGIRAHKHYKQARYGGKTFDSWRLAFRAKDSLSQYEQAIGFLGEKAARLRERVVEALARRMDRDDILPNFPKEACYHMARGGRAAGCKIQDRAGWKLLRNAPLEHICRTNAQRLAEHFGVGADLAYSDVWWDHVKTIEPVGERETWDLEVAGYHNFVANDIVVHNSETVSRLALYLTLGKSLRGWALAPTERLVGRIFKPLFQLIQASDVPIVEANESEMRIVTSTGGVLEGMTWGNPRQIEGEGIHFCICDETQQMTEDVYERIKARLVGNYLWIRIGSPAEEGRSFYEEHALELAGAIPNHRVFRFPTWYNPDRDIQQMLRIERQRLAALRKELGKDSAAYQKERAWFMRVYGGRSARPSDLVVSSFDAAVQVRPCPFDKDLPVYLFVDPGWSPAHYAVCAYQPHPRGEALGVDVHPEQDELWQIDELYVQHTVTEDVIRELKGREWWANVEKAVIDVAARQTNRQTGMREIDVWISLVRFPVMSQYVNLNESVGALRSWCAASRIFHDPVKCPHTIKEYSLWKMTKGSRDIPGDDWNDALQATSYGLVKLYGHTDAPAQPIVWRRTVNTVNPRWAWQN